MRAPYPACFPQRGEGAQIRYSETSTVSTSGSSRNACNSSPHESPTPSDRSTILLTRLLTASWAPASTRRAPRGTKSFRQAVTPGFPREQAGERGNDTNETRPRTLHCSKGDSDATLHHAIDGGGPGVEPGGCSSGRWQGRIRGKWLQVVQQEQQEFQRQQQQ